MSEIVISEVQYHPSNDNVYLEFIELTNGTDSAIDLSDWRIEDAVDAVVPLGTLIASGESIVLVAFDSADVNRAVAFRQYYGVPVDVRLIGPWGGSGSGFPRKLSNGGESITLVRPIDDHGTIVYAVSDQVVYDDKSPWPITPDGQGASLDRVTLVAFGNDAANWRGSVPSPGRYGAAPPLVGDANGDGVVNIDDLNAVRNNFGAVGAGLIGDTNGDNRVDIDDLNNVRNNFGAMSPSASDAGRDIPARRQAGRTAHVRLTDVSRPLIRRAPIRRVFEIVWMEPQQLAAPGS